MKNYDELVKELNLPKLNIQDRIVNSVCGYDGSSYCGKYLSQFDPDDFKSFYKDNLNSSGEIVFDHGLLKEIKENALICQNHFLSTLNTPSHLNNAYYAYVLFESIVVIPIGNQIAHKNKILREFVQKQCGNIVGVIDIDFDTQPFITSQQFGSIDTAIALDRYSSIDKETIEIQNLLISKLKEYEKDYEYPTEESELLNYSNEEDIARAFEELDIVPDNYCSNLVWDNSFNYNNSLSFTFQFCQFEFEGKCFAIIEIGYPKRSIVVKLDSDETLSNILSDCFLLVDVNDHRGILDEFSPYDPKGAVFNEETNLWELDGKKYTLSKYMG